MIDHKAKRRFTEFCDLLDHLNNERPYETEREKNVWHEMARVWTLADESRNLDEFSDWYEPNYFKLMPENRELVEKAYKSIYE